MDFCSDMNRTCAEIVLELAKPERGADGVLLFRMTDVFVCDDLECKVEERSSILSYLGRLRTQHSIPCDRSQTANRDKRLSEFPVLGTPKTGRRYPTKRPAVIEGAIELKPIGNASSIPLWIHQEELDFGFEFREISQIVARSSVGEIDHPRPGRPVDQNVGTIEVSMDEGFVDQRRKLVAGPQNPPRSYGVKRG